MGTLDAAKGPSKLRLHQVDVKFGYRSPSDPENIRVGVPEGFEVVDQNPITHLSLSDPKTATLKRLFEHEGYVYKRQNNGVAFSSCKTSPGYYPMLAGARIDGALDALPPPDASFNLENCKRALDSADCSKDGYLDGILLALKCLGVNEQVSGENPLLFTRDGEHLNVHAPAIQTPPQSVADLGFLTSRAETGIPASQLYGVLAKYIRGRDDCFVGLTPSAQQTQDGVSRYDCWTGKYDWEKLGGIEKMSRWKGRDNSGGFLHPRNRGQIHSCRTYKNGEGEYGPRVLRGTMDAVSQLTRGDAVPCFVSWKDFCDGGRAVIGGHVLLGTGIGADLLTGSRVDVGNRALAVAGAGE